MKVGGMSHAADMRKSGETQNPGAFAPGNELTPGPAL